MSATSRCGEERTGGAWTRRAALPLLVLGLTCGQANPDTGEAAKSGTAAPAAQQPAAAGSSPRIVAYYNGNTKPILANATEYPYTHYVPAFLIPDGPSGVEPSGPMQVLFASPDCASTLADIQAAGKKVLVSLGGSSVTADQWQSWSENADAVAEAVARIVEEHGLDGVDLDIENVPYITREQVDSTSGTIATLTLAIAKRLPDKLLSHAPQPPYLCAPGSVGCPNDYPLYAAVLAKTGDTIDWLNMQYYNNGDVTTIAADELANYRSIVAGWKDFPGIPARKLVFGKPLSPKAGVGYLPADELSSEVLAPLVEEYGHEFGGFMGWEYLFDENGDWARAIAATQGD